MYVAYTHTCIRVHLCIRIFVYTYKCYVYVCIRTQVLSLAQSAVTLSDSCDSRCCEVLAPA